MAKSILQSLDHKLTRNGVILAATFAVSLPLHAQPSTQSANPRREDSVAAVPHNAAGVSSEEDRDRLMRLAQKVVRDQDFEATLGKKVSVLVRNGLVKDIVTNIRAGGFDIPIELRDVPDVHITLGVRNVTANSVLLAAALFAGCDYCVMDDHILIAPDTSLKPEEVRYAHNPQVMSRHEKQTDIFVLTLAHAFDAMGKKAVRVGDLNPFLQELCQRIADQMAMETKKPTIKLAADTLVTYRPTEVGYQKFAIEILMKSPGVKYIRGFNAPPIRRQP